MSMHWNSLEAYDEERAKLNKRANAIFLYMRDLGSPITDRNVMRDMGFTEPNAVRPRITEMIKIGLMEEVGSIKCEVTKKTVRLVQIKHPPSTTHTQMDLI